MYENVCMSNLRETYTSHQMSLFVHTKVEATYLTTNPDNTEGNALNDKNRWKIKVENKKFITHKKWSRNCGLELVMT